MTHFITDLVESHYRAKGVSRPSEISLHLWDDVAPLAVIYRHGRTTATRLNNVTCICLDGRMPLRMRRVIIAHEIGHAVLHAGILDVDEREADLFSMESLIPLYLLLESLRDGPEGRGQTEQHIADLYGVPLPFAARRLDLAFGEYPNRVMYEETSEYDWMLTDPIDRDTRYQMWSTGEVVGVVRRVAGSLKR